MCIRDSLTDRSHSMTVHTKGLAPVFAFGVAQHTYRLKYVLLPLVLVEILTAFHPG